MSSSVVTLGSQWRQPREAGVPIRLPSGNVASIRSVGLDLVIRLGRVPDVLTPVIVDVVKGQGEGDLAGALHTMKDVQAVMEFLNAVVELCFVEPRIVDKPQAEDEISLGDVDWDDKWAVRLPQPPAVAGGLSLQTWRR